MRGKLPAEARARGLPGPNNSGLGYRRPPQPLSTRVRSFSLSSGDWAVSYRRRPTPGAEVFVDLDLPQGIPTPSLPFLTFETEHPNPNLSYLAI
jgi:hypothetical protein